MNLNRSIGSVSDTQPRTAFFGPFPQGSIIRGVHWLVDSGLTPPTAGAQALIGLSLFRDPTRSDDAASFVQSGLALSFPGTNGLFSGSVAPLFALQDIISAEGLTFVRLASSGVRFPLNIALDRYKVFGVLLGIFSAVGLNTHQTVTVDALLPDGKPFTY
ncbi:MAG: hypothetical protein ACREBG_14895 [Pyrinomonadaceae bacterium]